MFFWFLCVFSGWVWVSEEGMVIRREGGDSLNYMWIVDVRLCGSGDFLLEFLFIVESLEIRGGWCGGG